MKYNKNVKNSINKNLLIKNFEKNHIMELLMKISMIYSMLIFINDSV